MLGFAVSPLPWAVTLLDGEGSSVAQQALGVNLGSAALPAGARASDLVFE